ncbi:MAG: alpha-L-fucosidase [Bryobacteraceae bacterium]|jgi:alpha-L-fucosidase
MTRRTFLAAVSAAAPAFSFAKPKPFGALPSARQLAWHRLETTAFLHFTVNTFTDREWGLGDEDPNVFNPARFDADAIVEPLAAAGMTGVILTAKHHDGFCLWPTATSEHSVRASGWREGKGNVVGEIAAAARRHNLRFGIYLSPWDRSQAAYGKPEYIAIYRRQLTELLRDYGPIFEVWHDGANGGDGYYGGAREKRTIDKNTYYDWPGTWELVRRLQPEAVIFSDVGPDVRWVGNERGIAGDPCWATYDPVGADGGPASPGNVREKDSPAGTRHGTRWLPAECDVSIRPGWFWHEAENARVKTPAELVELYFVSVGRGANLLLNVPPNRDGLLSSEDIASLEGFGRWRRATFGSNLAAGARVTATNVRKGFGPQQLLDGREDTYWATDDATVRAEAVFDFARPVTFGVVRLREAIAFGQRVDAVAIDRWDGGDWRQFAASTSIGARRLIRLDRPVTAARLRLRVTEAAASPMLAEFALFAEPA